MEDIVSNSSIIVSYDVRTRPKFSSFSWSVVGHTVAKMVLLPLVLRLCTRLKACSEGRNDFINFLGGMPLAGASLCLHSSIATWLINYSTHKFWSDLMVSILTWGLRSGLMVSILTWGLRSGLMVSILWYFPGVHAPRSPYLVLAYFYCQWVTCSTRANFRPCYDINDTLTCVG